MNIKEDSESLVIDIEDSENEQPNQIEINQINKNTQNNQIKTIENKTKEQEEKKAKMINTDEKVQKMIKSMNKLIQTHISEMKKAKEELSELIENTLLSHRGIVSHQQSQSIHKKRMEYLNLLTKTFDTTDLEREFNETKKKYG